MFHWEMFHQGRYFEQLCFLKRKTQKDGTRHVPPVNGGKKKKQHDLFGGEAILSERHFSLQMLSKNKLGEKQCL